MSADSAADLAGPVPGESGRRSPAGRTSEATHGIRLALNARLVRPTWAGIVSVLPLPFMVVGTADFLVRGIIFGGGYAADAHTYYRGAAAWLAGRDPWQAIYQVGGATYHFAALPWALPFIAPITLLPESIAVTTMVLLAAVAAAVILRCLGLPVRWFIFPPLVHGILNGNPIVMCVAMILVNWPVAVLIRPQLIWALIGERRWRTILAGGAIAAVLVAFVPIGTFLGDLKSVTGNYQDESAGGSSGGTALALVTGIVAVLVIAIRNQRTAGWLATIAAWPLNSWYGGIAALPVLTPLLAIGLSLLVVGLPVWTIVLFAVAQGVVQRVPVSRAFLEPLVRPYRPAPGDGRRKLSLPDVAVGAWVPQVALPVDAKA